MKSLAAAFLLLASRIVIATATADEGVVLTNRSPSRETNGIRALSESGPEGRGIVLTNRSPAARAAETHQSTPDVAPEPSASSPEVRPPAEPLAQEESMGTEQTPPAFGQWVDTAQRGWLYMPYGDEYTSEGSSVDASPYQYDYDSTEGWTWIPAPWVWGWGPYPNFGSLGPGRFGWYRGLLKSGFGWGGYRGGAHPGGFTRGGFNGAPAIAPRGSPADGRAVGARGAFRGGPPRTRMGPSGGPRAGPGMTVTPHLSHPSGSGGRGGRR